MDIHHLTLEFARADEAGDPNAFRTGTQDYVLRSSGGDYAGVTLKWNDSFFSDLETLRRPRPDAATVQAIGEVLRQFVAPSGWQRQAAAATAATASGQTVVLTIRSAAAEIYALPWELLTLANGQHLGAQAHVLLRYEVPGATVVPPTNAEGGRILFGWSAAGGAVPASRHQSLIADACARGHHPFDPAVDVAAHLTLEGLATRVADPAVRVLHLLAHGGAAGERSHGLSLDAGDGSGPVVVDPGQLSRALAPHAGHLRMVVLCACDSGNAGEVGNPLGSLAYALHRAGIALVVASRFPLSVDGSALLTEAFYDSLLGGPTSVETAMLKARRRLMAESATLDWASIQLYVRADDEADSRPIVFRPFRGLLAYQPSDARFFFGRDGERAELLADLDALRDAGRPRFLVVAGASGTGKSSMVLAGAVPDLLGHHEAAHHRDETVEVEKIVDALRRLLPTYDPPAVRQSLELLVQLSPGVKSSVSGWRYFTLRPGARPMAALDAVLDGVTLRDGPVLIIVDQFEELFTQCADAAERERFARRLWSLARLSDAATHVIITIRVDYLGQCGELTVDESGLRLDRVAYDEAYRVFVAQMTPQQMRAAIEEPAHKVGLSLEAGLVDRMLADVEGEPGALPLLSYTLDLIWQARSGRMLTQAAYDAVGGVAGALHGRAEAIIVALNPHEQHQARRLLVRLVAVEDGAWDARRRVRIDDVRPALLWDIASFDLALAALVDARLLVQGQENEHATVELAHEALIRRWARLRAWIVEDQEMLAQVNTVERWVAAWQSFGTLLLDDQLGYASQVRDQHAGELSDDARTLIHESETQLETAQRKRRVMFIGTLGLTVVVALTMLGLGIYGLAKKAQADENFEKARLEARDARDQSARAKTATRVSVARGLEYRDPLAASLFLLDFAGVNGVDVSAMADVEGYARLKGKAAPSGARAVAHRLIAIPAPVRRLANAKVIDERLRAAADDGKVDGPSIRFARSGEVLTAVDGILRVHAGARAQRLVCDPAKAPQYSVRRSGFARDGQGQVGMAVALWEESTRGGEVDHRLCAAHTDGRQSARLEISPGLPTPKRLSVSADGRIVAAIWDRLPCALMRLATQQPKSMAEAVKFARGLPDHIDEAEECALIARWKDQAAPEYVPLDLWVTAFDISPDGAELVLAQPDVPERRLELDTLGYLYPPMDGLVERLPSDLRYVDGGRHIVEKASDGWFVWSIDDDEVRSLGKGDAPVDQVEVRERTVALRTQGTSGVKVVVVFDGTEEEHDTDVIVAAPSTDVDVAAPSTDVDVAARAPVARIVLVDGRNPRVGLLRPGVHWQFTDMHTPLLSDAELAKAAKVGSQGPRPKQARQEKQETQETPETPERQDEKDLPKWLESTAEFESARKKAEVAPSVKLASDQQQAERKTFTVEACNTNVQTAQVGPRGRVVLVVTDDEVCLLPTTPDAWTQTLPIRDVISAEFRADGRQIALLTRDGAASVWPVDAGVPHRMLASLPVVKVWFPRAAAQRDAPELYGLDTRDMLHRWQLGVQGVRTPFESVENVEGEKSVSDDGAWAVVADPDGHRLRPLRDDTAPIKLVGYERADMGGGEHRFSPDSTRLAQIVKDGVRVWYLPDGAATTLPDPDERDLRAGELVWAPDGQHLLVYTDNRLVVWRTTPAVDVRTVFGDVVGRTTPSEALLTTRPLRSGSRVLFHPDGAHLLIDSGEPVAGARARRASDLEPELSRVPLARVNESLTFPVPAAARFGEVRVSDDGRYVVAVGEVDGRTDRLLVWRLDKPAEAPRVIQSTEAADGYEISGVAFAAYGEGKARRTFVLIRSNVGAVERRALDADVSRLDGTFTGHTSAVEDLVFHPTGKLVTWDSDDVFQLRVARDETGALGLLGGRFTLQALDAGTGNLQSAVFSTDGRWLVARSGQGRVWAWPLAWADMMRQLRDRTDACLTAEERTRSEGVPWDEAQAAAAGCLPPQPR